MAVGLSLPWRVNKRGGLRLSVGNDTIRKILATALGNNDSNNPFQEEGITDPTFQPGDETTFTALADQIRDIFEGMQQAEIAALQRRADNLAVQDKGGGDFEMQVYWVNLETDLPGEATVSGGLTGIFVV